MTASKISIGLASALVIAATVFHAKQHQAQVRLRDENHVLRQQVGQLATEAQGLSKKLAQVQSAQTDDNDRLRELMRLRGEVGTLKRQLNEAARVKEAGTSPAKTPDDPVEQQKQMAVGKMRDTKVWIMAFEQYAQGHEKQFPTNFEQVASYVDEALRNDLNPGETLRDKQDFVQTTNQFEILYQGSVNEITNSMRTIVMREKEPWQSLSGGWCRTYGFADGHTEVHKTEDGNFGPWEAQLVQNPAGP